MFYFACFAGFATPVAEAGDLSAWGMIEGMGIAKNDDQVDGSAYEVPPEVEGPIRYWAAVGHEAMVGYPGNEKPVSEEDVGIFFFGSNLAAIAFLPHENAGACQDVIFSPDGAGEKFVLVTGSGIRADMTFEVYSEGVEMLAEFDGVRGQLAWIDPVRFVFTRIDDIREAGAVFNLSYSLRFSVVMYDTAARETTVLKEATDTQNFWFPEVIENGSALTVTEDSVKSEQDWDDEEKIERREIRVEIPAAG